MNIDSLTSLRILVGLFKSDVIPYEIIAVQNYEEVDKEIMNCQKIQEEILGFVFINCVGEMDLTKYWFSQEKNILALIAESKRPIHHQNCRNKTNIVIIDDGSNNLEYCPTEKEMEIIRQKVINVDENKEKLNLEKNDENEDKKDEKKNKEEDGENIYPIGKDNKEEKNSEENDEEEKNEENENGAENEINEKNTKKKIVKKRNDINDEDFNELKNEKDSLDEIADEVSAKPEKQSLQDNQNENSEENAEENEENSQEKKINEKIKEIEEINIKVNEYYGGSYYGLPSTYVFYSIAHQLHKENTYYLWYLIISMTDEYLRYHISDKKYDKIYAICQNEILRIEKKKSKEDDTLKIYKSTAKEGKTILIGSDYKLILYRHWNLYDSFIYSTYPLGILSTWKEPGKGEVQKIFAYMGIPLSEARQKYRYMKNEYLDTFRDKIIDVSKKFFLNEIIFHSFIYQFDNNTEMSASDCVYLLSCLIECPFEEFNNLEIEDDEFNEDNSSNISDDEEEKNNKSEIGDKGEDEEHNSDNIISKKNRKNENTLKKFWMAYRFLSLKKLNMTNSLIDIAIKFQIALTNSATAILDKNGVKNEQKFRYSIVSGNLSDDSRYFHYPGNLERLCLVISETYKQLKGKKIENKPYLLAYIDAENKTYVIDGNLGCNKKDDEEKNTFPIQFKFVAKKLKIPVSYNYSTEEIITIKKDDLYSFINQIAQL